MSHLSDLWRNLISRYSPFKTQPPQTSSTVAAETTLHESEAFYRQTFESSPTVKVVIDLTTLKIVQANQAACEFYGYTLEEMRARSITDINATATDEVDKRAQSILSSANHVYKSQHRLVSGQIRDVEIFVGRIEVNGKTYLCIDIQDITASETAERNLRESEERYRSLIELAPVGIVGNDLDGKRIFWNKRWCEITGLSPDDERVVEDYPIYPDDVPTIRAALKQMRQTGQPIDNITGRYMRPDGTLLWIAGNARPMFDGHGQVNGFVSAVIDMTERKQLEEDLRRSEERFHSLVNLAPVGIIQTDAKGERVFANSRWCEMTGLTLEQALSDETYESIYPDDLEISTGAWDTMMETGLPFDNVVFRYQRPDKITVWVSGNGKPLFDGEGKVTGYIGCVIDITEHKQLEEALLTSESRFRTLVDLAPVGIVETDAHGEILLGNTQWHVLSGVTEEELLTNKTYDTIHPDDRQRVQALQETSVQNGAPLDNIEHRFVHKDNAIVWVSDSSRPLYEPDGSISGHIITVTDITDRKRLEDALRRNEERLRLITDSIQDLITQTDGEGKIIFASPSYKSLLGYEPEALMGKLVSDLTPIEDTVAVMQAMQAAIASGTMDDLYRSENRLIHADGHLISTETLGKLLFDESGFLGGVYITRDVSERKRMQDLMLEKEKLQTELDKEFELNNLKTRMMNRIAHEFRTPLSVIQSTTETLTHYLDRLNQDQRRAKGDTIRGQILRLTNMLDEIGQVIKTDFTPDLVHRVQTDLSALSRQIAMQLEQQLHLPGKFILHIPDTYQVALDPQVIRNAFVNIMQNAARFSEPSTPVDVTLTCDETSITFKVVDQGIGIAPNEVHRIFEPFFRGSNIGEISGLGVGLTMTRAAIEAHGGKISVESVLSQGTTVTIWIPVERPTS